jgi:2-oxo-4-hydroxy-4-carboxy-5-ureidoimidazoline decarboxylase
MTVDLRAFNAVPGERLRPMLAACCDVDRWVDRVLAGRPYDDVAALTAVADQAARDFDEAEVERALAAHPRIGDRADGESTEASWSRDEQAGVGEDAGVRAALAEGNGEYERRFGRVFLICATGLSAGELLAELRRRLGNDEATERAVVRDELRKIAVLRLSKVVDQEISV